MKVAAPADKRFRRAHVSPARKRSWREPTVTVVRLAVALGVAAFLAYRATALVLSAEAMTVTDIRVSGVEQMSRGEVVALLDDLRGTSMVTVDLEAARQRLLSAPWVADAVVRRVFPNTVAVAIRERQPMAIGRIADRLYLVDREGITIDEFGPNYADMDLPIIDGLAAAATPSGLLVDESRAVLVARMLMDLERRPELAQRVSQIDVSDPRDAVVMLKGDTTFVRLGQERFAERVQAYLDLIPALRERVAAIDYVDLRFDERIYVRPQESRQRR